MNLHLESMISILEQSLIAYKKGDYNLLYTLAEKFSIESHNQKIKDENPELINTINIANRFIEAFSDSANHDFQYYHLKQSDWPEMALELI